MSLFFANMDGPGSISHRRIHTVFADAVADGAIATDHINAVGTLDKLKALIEAGLVETNEEE